MPDVLETCQITSKGFLMRTGERRGAELGGSTSIVTYAFPAPA